MKCRLIYLFSLLCLTLYNCSKDSSPIPISPKQQIIDTILPNPVVNRDSLARVDFNKYLIRILDAGSCTGCHDGGAFGGPGPGDFGTYDKFKLTVLKSGNPMRIEGLGEMSDCSGNYGCLTPLQKDSLSNWLQKYFSL
jgi:hypothetical protein